MKKNDNIILSDLTNRFLEEVNRLEISFYEIAKVTGVKSQLFTKIKKGIQKPSLKFLNAFCCAYPQANKAYILTGEGTPLKPTVPESPQPRIALFMKAKNEISERFLNVISDLSLKDYEIWKSVDNISKEQLSKIRRGVNGASIKVIDAFCDVYPEANKIYILTGEGTPIKETNQEKEEVSPKKKTRIKRNDSSSEDILMLLDVIEEVMKDLDIIKSQNAALMQEILNLKLKEKESKDLG